MTDTTLTAYPREIIGHANRKLAAEGRIPAVVYGAGRETMPVSVDRHAFEQFVAHHGGTVLISLTIEGEKKPINVVIKEVQHSAVKGTVLHVDFLAVRMDQAIHATVPLNLVNDPDGVKAGGVLTVNMHEITIEAKPADLPEAIDVDVSALQVGDSLHVGDIVAPKGTTILDDAEAIVCSVQAPRVEVEEAAEEEITEPEVIGAAETEEE